MRNPELWTRLEAYLFDTGTGSAPFSAKLARTQGWDARFTARVIAEYRRFLYLTQVTKTQVTPSQIVDAAWHMHLKFTRDYWNHLCPNVIGAPIHHQPCAGGEEMPRYRDQFSATKALYEAEFGTEPPVGIWGCAKPKSRMKVLACAEGGAISINSNLLVGIAVAGCLGLYFAGFDLHWMVYGLIIFAAYLLGMVIGNNSKSKGCRKRWRDNDGHWIEYDESGERTDPVVATVWVSKAKPAIVAKGSGPRCSILTATAAMVAVAADVGAIEWMI